MSRKDYAESYEQLHRRLSRLLAQGPGGELLRGDLVVVGGLVIEVDALQRVAQRLLAARVKHLGLRLAGVRHPRHEEDLGELAPVVVLHVPVQDQVPGLVRGELIEEVLELEVSRDWTDVAHIGHGSGRIDLEGDELVRALLPEDGELRLALVGGKDF